MTKPDLRCLEEKTKAGMAFIDWLSINYRQDHFWCPSAQLMPHVRSCTWDSGQYHECPE